MGTHENIDAYTSPSAVRPCEELPVLDQKSHIGNILVQFPQGLVEWALNLPY
jgi:hypothetical protein